MASSKEEWLGGRGKGLEEEFFAKQSRLLVEKQQELKRLEETKQALSAASGITDETVIGRLMELGVRPDTLAALSLVPLVAVAWADGSIDAKERQAVLEAAEKSSITKGSIEHDLLEQWLTDRPDSNLLAAWTEYLHGLCQKLSPEEKQSLKEELLGRARVVAEASGGIMGLAKVSRDETEILRKLEKAFG